MKYNFKTYDKVLVRKTGKCADNIWYPVLFGRIIENRLTIDGTKSFYADTSDMFWDECIPYEGNEKLAYTSDTLYYFKEHDLVAVTNDKTDSNSWRIAVFDKMIGDRYCVYRDYEHKYALVYDYCEPAEKHFPNIFSLKK